MGIAPSVPSTAGAWASPDADLTMFLRRRAAGGAPGAPPQEGSDTLGAAWRGVYCRIYAAVRDRDQAEELTQEVFCRVLHRLDTGRTAALTRAYLLQVAENLVRDRWRAEARRRDAPRRHDRSWHGGSPEEAALRGEERSILQHALLRLSPRQRQVLYLRISVGLSATETGEATGLSAAAVRQVQRRSLTTLRRHLAEAGPDAAAPG